MLGGPRRVLIRQGSPERPPVLWAVPKRCANTITCSLVAIPHPFRPISYQGHGVDPSQPFMSLAPPLTGALRQATSARRRPANQRRAARGPTVRWAALRKSDVRRALTGQSRSVLERRIAQCARAVPHAHVGLSRWSLVTRVRTRTSLGRTDAIHARLAAFRSTRVPRRVKSAAPPVMTGSTRWARAVS